MSYEDERLAAIRLEEKKKKYDNVDKGMYAGDELLLFQRHLMFDSSINIMMPQSFEIMNDNDAKRKYPSINRPQVILANTDGKVNFTFSLFEEKAENVDTMRMLEDFRIFIQKMQPSNQSFDHGEIRLLNGNCSWLDFKAYVLDGELYNLLSVIQLDNFVILGMFNCPFHKWPHWKTVMLKILETIQKEGVDETN